MAQVLSSYKAFGVYIDEPITTRAYQALQLVVTQAATDVTLDIGNPVGTFWTAVGGTVTGAAALLALNQIIAKADSRDHWCSKEIQDPYVQVAVAPASATQYELTGTSVIPSIVFFAASAPVAVTINIVVLLKGQERAVRAGSL